MRSTLSGESKISRREPSIADGPCLVDGGPPANPGTGIATVPASEDRQATDARDEEMP